MLVQGPMHWIKRLGALLAIAVSAATCSAVGIATQDRVDAPEAGCASAQFEAGIRVLSCVEAVAAAEASLGWLHAPISSAVFRNGAACPPNARCFFGPTNGVVRFEFWFGDPVDVGVHLDEHGVVVAGEPEFDADPIEVPPMDEDRA